MRSIFTIFSLFIVFSQLAYGQTPSSATSTVTVSPATIRISGTSTITVQLKDASGNNITGGGASVTFTAPSTGSIGTVTDNGNGTYTATYTASTTTGLVTITPSVNSVSFTNTATIGIGTILSSAKGGHLDGSTYSTTGGLTLGLGLRTRYLIVGGGGGGGNTGGGGGGGGGFIEGETALLPAAYSLTVGAGGSASTAANVKGGKGGSSSFNGLSTDGGGGGGSFTSTSGATGGSGGGGSNNGAGGARATAGQGNAGGGSYGDANGGSTVRGGGGGGANAAGSAGSTAGGNGGAGKSSNIVGTTLNYAGGGGGGVGSSVANAGTGGLGGGGNGGKGSLSTTAATNGLDGRGAGGGGAGAIPGGSGTAGAGGSGIVILQYSDAATATGGTQSDFTGDGTNGMSGILYRVRSFTTTGTSTFDVTAIDYEQLSTTLSTAISGTGALNFNSPGQLILTGANTYSGGTNIRYGTLQVGNGGTTGVLGSGNVINQSTLAFNRTNALTITNAISGSGHVLQNGTGATTLSGTNSYTGSTQVNAGSLLINGNHTAATGPVNVASGAKLGGIGTIGGAVTVQNGGELTPGTSPGILTAANGLQLSAGSTFTWELTANSDDAGLRGTSYDGVDVTGGTLSIETGVTSSLVFTTGVDFTNSFWRTDHQWLVFDNASAATLNSSEIFDQISVSADANGRTLTNQTGLGGARFFWTVVGNAIYLNYESGYPSAANSLLYTDRSSIPVNSGIVANLTIQLKDASENNLTYSGGTLTFPVVSSGTVSSITDNQDGTYTAVYNPGSTAAGTVTLTPAINGVNFSNSLQLTIVNELSLPSAPDGLRVTENYATGTTGVTFGLGLGIEYLVLGGGGAGGLLGGGGGAGEFLEGNQVVFDGVSNTVVVGNGGQTSSANGADSRFNAAVAKGGGGGGNIGARGKSGGSGGGGSRSTDGGIDGLGNTGGSSTKSTGLGNVGGQSRGFAGEHLKGGGGGGAGAAGETAPTGTARSGNGGIGRQSSITGIAAYYAAGGGGGAGSSISAAGQGGLGGGGNGGRGAASVGADGTLNTGSGGGGGGSTGGSGAAGGKGGSGVVFVRYPGSADLATGGTESAITVGGKPYRLHSFTSTGSSSLTFSLGAFDFSSYSSEISGIISGGGPITFNSTGKLRLTGANTYTGSTTIASGTLEVGDGGTTGNLGSGAVVNNGALIINRSNNVSVSNAMSGTGSLAQNGTGVTTLTAANTYTGSTQVSAGTLLINGNHSAATGNVTVATSAKLGGTGTIGGAVTVQSGGELTPGTSPGILTAANGLQLSAGSTFTWELTANTDDAGLRGTSYDGVDVTGGTLSIETGVTSSLVFTTGVDFTNSFWRTDHQWLLFDNASAATLNSSEIFDQISVSADANGRTLTNQTGLGGARFFWTVVGDDLYLNYESGYPSASNSLAYTDRSSIPVNSGIVANLTIQLKDANGNNLTYSGGTLTFPVVSSGTVSSITDNQDGTYTAVYNPGSTAVGTVTLTPAINGVNFTNSLQINIVNELSLPSAPDGLRVTENYATGTTGITFGLGLGIEYLVVGGGGAGGRLGGGGGAGEFLEGNQVVFDGVSNTVVVGNGGQTSSANGDDSRFNASVAKGGGGGGNIGVKGKSGGSGGGGSRNTDGGIDGWGNLGGSSTKSTGFGNAGGQSRGYAGEHLKGGGGGGAGAAGETAPAGTTRSGNGGIGRQSSITGTAVYYAAGGGGGAGSSISAAGQGGLGGGGNGGRGATSAGADGTDNRGSGGGGGGSTGGSGAAGGKGGSGVVFVRYAGSTDLASGGTESAITVGGKPYRLHSFTSTGSSSLTFSLGAFDFSSYSSEISGIISGGGPITFNSTGKLRLTGANTYTGSTTIASGTLEVGDGGTTGNLGSGAVVNNGSLIFNRSNSLTIAHAISGTGSLAQAGAGMLTLSGTSNSYTGSTSVSAGHLRINSTITSSSGVTVASGATLSGTGTLPTTTVSGTHAPGTSPGVQSITGDLSYATGSTFQWELIANDATAGDRGTDFDGVNVSGALTIQTGVTSSLVFNGTGSAVDWTDPFWSSNRSWLVFDNVGTPTVSGTIFGTITVSPDKNGVQLTSVSGRSNAGFFWSQVGNDIYLNYSTNAVLPVTWKRFTGREKNGQVELNWETASEQNTKDFVVEHSTNAIGWKAIGSLMAAGNSSSLRSYSFLHSQPSVKNYYRLLQRDLDGKQSYSSIVNVNVAEPLAGIRILGNPVKNKQLVIQLEKATTIVIHSISGQQIYQGHLEAGTHRINLPASPGLYHLKAGMHRIPFLLE